MSDQTQTESLSFQTEVQQILHLMIHSLYSDKEIFLRELISNASDACDKLRFESLTDEGLLESGDELDVHVSIDKDARTVTVSDNGIGMTRDEVIENIGTIARSGTKQFIEAMTGENSSDANLIGQFGVGFYSAFIVADKVSLTTRKAGQAASSGVMWSSDGSEKYEISTVERPQRGTEVTLHLREGEDEFLESYRLRSIVSKYSDHISLPIKMLAEPPSGDDKDKEKSDAPEWEVANKGSALWARSKKDITEEEYNTFYTSVAYDPQPPMCVIHNQVEGTLEYVSLLYIPSKAPFDLWDREQRHGVKLYVRRIFIMDDAKYLMPSYMRFVRGVVDCADLPLNVSREFLQKNREIDKIRAGSVKKILGELAKLANNDAEKYQSFWDEFGKVLKEGVVEDIENQKPLSELLRFATTHDDNNKQTVSLQAYVKRMPLKQKSIYYITAETHAAAQSSPHLEIFRKHGIEVLLLSDPIDEWVVNHLTEYNEKPLQSVAKGSLDLDDFEETKKDKKQEKEFKDTIEKINEALSDSVKEVRVSHRLTDSPACLVADETDMGGNLERMLKAMGQDAPTAKPIMEINPDHPIIENLKNDSSRVDDWAHVLFDQAALSEGAALKQPAAYVKRVNSLLTKSAQVTPPESTQEANT
ncbi:MAG: molecular chaperone HtpG [Gammaproteobacteria bacterium]|nr:molecular chaperone HtpG [Gammaproteobacteria bacterium]